MQGERNLLAYLVTDIIGCCAAIYVDLGWLYAGGGFAGGVSAGLCVSA